MISCHACFSCSAVNINFKISGQTHAFQRHQCFVVTQPLNYEIKNPTKMLKFFGLLQTQKSTPHRLTFCSSQRSTRSPAYLSQKKETALLENSQNSQYSVSLTIHVVFFSLSFSVFIFFYFFFSQSSKISSNCKNEFQVEAVVANFHK